MKKKLVFFAVAVILVLTVTMTACSHTFVCSICHQEKSGKSYKSEIFGQKIEICDDCYNASKSLYGG